VIPSLFNMLTGRFPAERPLDFTCCDIEPAVLGIDPLSYIINISAKDVPFALGSP